MDDWMIAEIERRAREHAAAAPPLTLEQKDALRRLFAPVVAKMRAEAASREDPPQSRA